MREAPADLGAEPPSIPGVTDLELIGRGGSGLVYRGRQEQLARDVAVKVLATASATPSALKRWQREVQTMGRLSNHPNIVAVYDSGLTSDGRPYLVMPFIPAGSLGDRVRSDGPLAVGEAVDIGVKIAGALTAAHEAGVLHRDVKPDNVLLSPYEPQLADFGIARLVDATTTAATAIGQIHATINYAAPEVLAGEPASEASDVYGLGATLYTALHGDVPFPHEADANVVAVAHQIIHDPSPSLHGEVAEPVAAVVSQAMAKEPALRYGSAAELAAALESAGDRRSTTTAATTTVTTPATPTVPVDRIPPSRPPARADEPVVSRIAQRRGVVGDRRFPFALGVLGAALVAVAAFLLVASDDNGDRANAPPDNAATTAASAAEPTTRPASADSAVVEAGRRYFTLLSRGDYASAYNMLSPGFRQVQSQASFESFWRSVSPVSIRGPVTARGLRVTVPITMGSRGHTYVLTLTRGGDTLYVDGPRPQ